MHNQTALNKYFSGAWTPGNNSITSHAEISKNIRDEEWVLDVGCGANSFKHLLKNVIGIDPVFKEADIMCTIEEYIPDRLFDVATCLGSINFGDIDTITAQIEKVVLCLKPESRIYWRLNPGRKDHGNTECMDIPFFHWTHALLREFSKKHGYVQINEQEEVTHNRIRLYAEWHRAGH